MARNRVQLKIKGLDDLRHAVRQYGAALVDGVVEAVRVAVDDTVTSAKAAAPVGRYPATWNRKRAPGHLRDSIDGRISTSGYAVTGRVRARAGYAHLIEFGSERIDAHPFLTPAAIREQRELNARLRRVVIEKAPPGLGKPRVRGEGPGTPKVSIEPGSAD